MTINDLFSQEIFNSPLKDKSFAGKELSKICANSDFIFYGAGQTGQLLYQQLDKINIHPKAFADDTISKQGEYIGSKKIYSLQEAQNFFGDETLIIVTIFHPSVSFLEVKTRLNLAGFKNVASFFDVFILYPSLFLPFYHFASPSVLLEQKDNYNKAFELFEEQRSKETFVSNLNFRLSLDHTSLYAADKEDYFPVDIFPSLRGNSSCIYIDCGAYDGDTVRKFLLKQFGKTRIFAFEPDEYNFKKLTEFVVGLNNEISKDIYLHNVGISDTHGFFKFSSSNSMGSSLSETGNTTIQTISLDDMLYENIKHSQDPVFIKMDIEGEEMKALQGCRNLIKEITPHLAISIYHNPDDLWRIPLYINSINSEYNFFLRQHGNDSMDLVLYAIAQ